MNTAEIHIERERRVFPVQVSRAEIHLGHYENPATGEFTTYGLHWNEQDEAREKLNGETIEPEETEADRVAEQYSQLSDKDRELFLRMTP